MYQSGELKTRKATLPGCDEGASSKKIEKTEGSVVGLGKCSLTTIVALCSLPDFYVVNNRFTGYEKLVISEGSIHLQRMGCFFASCNKTIVKQKNDH